MQGFLIFLNGMEDELLSKGEEEKLKKVLCMDDKTKGGRQQKSRTAPWGVGMVKRERRMGKRKSAALYENIALYFNEGNIMRVKGICYRTTENPHGQVEIQGYYQISDRKWLADKEKWIGLKSIGMARTPCIVNKLLFHPQYKPIL